MASAGVPNSYAVGPQARQAGTERKDGWASMPKLSGVLTHPTAPHSSAPQPDKFWHSGSQGAEHTSPMTGRAGRGGWLPPGLSPVLGAEGLGSPEGGVPLLPLVAARQKTHPTGLSYPEGKLQRLWKEIIRPRSPGGPGHNSIPT